MVRVLESGSSQSAGARGARVRAQSCESSSVCIFGLRGGARGPGVVDRGKVMTQQTREFFQLGIYAGLFLLRLYLLRGRWRLSLLHGREYFLGRRVVE